jgi:hypothetical protein
MDINSQLQFINSYMTYLNLLLSSSIIIFFILFNLENVMKFLTLSLLNCEVLCY